MILALAGRLGHFADLVARLADDLELLAQGQCWQGNFANCDNGGCAARRVLIAEARKTIGREPGTDSPMTSAQERPLRPSADERTLPGAGATFR